ncbi:MAG: DUF4340 domain-containing protein [Polyangiales bacterium]
MGRTSIVLLAIAAALAAFILFFERGSLSTTEREGRRGRVLESFVRAKVKRIELQRRGITTVLVHVDPNPDDQFDAGGWRVEAPYKAKADQALVDELLGALEYADARRSLGDASKDELEQFGLVRPRYRVSFVAGEQRTSVSVGLPAADNVGSYLTVRDQPGVYVVGRELLDALEHVAEDYHDKNLHEGVSIHTLERLSIASAETPERRAARHADDFLWLEQPYVGLASYPELNTFLNDVDVLKASRYIADAASSAYGLEAPRFTLVIDSKVYDAAAKKKGERKQERLDLRVGGPCVDHAGESYLQVNQGLVFCIADAEWKKLDRPSDALREVRLLPVDDSAISSVQVHAGPRELTLQTNEQATRYRVTDNGREVKNDVADPEALTAWYAALRETKIVGFDALEQTQRDQLAQHGFTATFARGKNQPPYTLRLVPLSDGSVIASRLDEAALLKLPPAAAELLAPSGARFRKKRVIDEDESKFTTLALQRPGQLVERAVKDAAGGYSIVLPVAGPADRAAVDELLRVISKLDAVRFVADSPLREHGLADPIRVVDVDYKDPLNKKVHTHRLLIGAPVSAVGDEGRYARLMEDPAVFVLPPAVINKLDVSLRKAQ